MCLHLCRLTKVLRQRREFVDVLAGVLAAGHAEAELEVKALEQLLSEIMSLNHPEVFYRHVSDCEFNAEGTKKNRDREKSEHERQKQTNTYGNIPAGDYILLNKDSHLRGSNLPQAEKSRGELVADKPASVWVNVPLLPSFVYREDQLN